MALVLKDKFENVPNEKITTSSNGWSWVEATYSNTPSKEVTFADLSKELPELETLITEDKYEVIKKAATEKVENDWPDIFKYINPPTYKPKYSPGKIKMESDKTIYPPLISNPFQPLPFYSGTKSKYASMTIDPEPEPVWDKTLGFIHPPIPKERKLPYMMPIEPETFSRLLKYSIPVVKGLATLRQVRDSARELALAGKVGMITLDTGAKLYIRRHDLVFLHYAESYTQDGSDIDPYIQEVK